jgi:hypothetical protein
MFQRSELQQIGRRVLAGGLIVAALTLSVVIIDQVVTGGTPAIRATCVLFLWTGGAAIAIGMILRIVGAGPRLSRPMPRPRPQRRSRRSPIRH